MTPLVKTLVAQIDALLEALQRANSEIQQMRDEIARLKGQKVRPKFKSSKMDENTDWNQIDGDDEGVSPQNGEKSKRAGSAKRSKTALNTSTALGVGSISLAFAFGQLWWRLTQPFAGAVADRIGAWRVIFIGLLLVAIGTFITPLMMTTTTAGLIFAIGVLGAGGAGMPGPSVLMAATQSGDGLGGRGAGA